MGRQKTPPRLTYQGIRVLKAFYEAFRENVHAELAGADVMRRARLSSGTIYPLLLRFENAGLLDSRWEKQRAQDLGRPRRRLYSLTSNGAEYARQVLEELAFGSTPIPQGG